MAEWRDNHGFMPADCKGKRVAVKLRNGMVMGEAPIANGAPAGWPADGDRGACRWSFTKGPSSAFDIVQFRVL